MSESMIVRSLFILSFAFLSFAQSSDILVSYTNTSRIVETSVFAGPSGTVTEVETFVPTTYSSLSGLTSAIQNTTIYSYTNGSSTVTQTYTYDIGSSGVGWAIPAASSGEPLLAEPSVLPLNSPRTSDTTSPTNEPTNTSPTGNSTATGPTTRPTTNTSPTLTASNSTTTGPSTTPGETTTIVSTSIVSNNSTTFTSLTTLTGTDTGSQPIPTGGPITSGGSTFLPSSSTRSGTDVITGTITSPPSDFTAFTLSGDYSSNQWITTTNSDHSTTLVPFIWLGGGRGIELWNLPELPDVEFSFPKVPKLPEFHLPCVKVFGVSVGDCTSPPVSDGPPPDGSPTETATNTGTETTSDTSCTDTQTASDCVASCVSTATDSTCESYTTTCTKTVTGCSVEGTTSTTTDSTSTVKGCATAGAVAIAAAEATPTLDPLDFRKRAIAGRVTMHPLQKRAASSPYRNFGGCALDTPDASKLTRPAWPAVTGDMLDPEVNGDMDDKYDVISRWYRATRAGENCYFTVTKLDAAAFKDSGDSTDFAGKKQGDNNKPSLDHAYEKEWIKAFFEQAVGQSAADGKLGCNDANQYFFPGSGDCKQNVLQSVFDQLAGNDNLKFVAMSQYVNSKKGMFFAGDRVVNQKFIDDPKFFVPDGASGSDWQWASKPGKKKPYSAKDRIEQMIIYFEGVLYGVMQMNLGDTLPLLDSTNNAIFNELQNLDNLIKANDGELFGDTTAYFDAFPDGMSSAYQDWMTEKSLPQLTTPPEYLTKLWKRIADSITNSKGLLPEDDDNALAEWQKLDNLRQAHEDQYGNGGGYEWEYSFGFNWDTSETKKRDPGALLERAGSCSPPTTNSTSVPPTTKPTTTPITTPPPDTSTITTPSPTATTCYGNQIEGDCVPESLPSSPPNSGQAGPVCDKVDSDDYPYLRFNADQTSDAVAEYCNNLISDNVVLDASSTAPNPGTVSGAAEDDGDVKLSILFDSSFCDEGTAEEDQKVDFAAMGADACYEALYTGVAEVCAQDSTWGDYDPDHTLEGGAFGYKCAIWALSGLPAS